jgi:hypothetical protein
MEFPASILRATRGADQGARAGIASAPRGELFYGRLEYIFQRRRLPETAGGVRRSPRGPKNLFKEDPMKIRLAALFGALMLASASAFAFHCPADMKKIDAALAKNPKLSAQQAADVKKFRADGEASHKAGKHQESVDTLAKAMKILGI